MRKFARFISERVSEPLLGTLPAFNNQSESYKDSLELGTKGNPGKNRWKIRLQNIKNSAISFVKDIFYKPIDFLLFCGLLCTILFVSWWLFSSLLFTYNVELDLSGMNPLVHAGHGDDNDERFKVEKQQILQYTNNLKLITFEDSASVPSVFLNECRFVSELERLQGRSSRGTDLPLLLEVLCQMAHDQGSHSQPFALTPRLINATLLAQAFARKMGWPLSQINTASRKVSDEIMKSELLFFEKTFPLPEPLDTLLKTSFGAKTKEPGSETINTQDLYILEDLCVVTFKDPLGICYHYFNPEVITLEEHTNKQPSAANTGLFDSLDNGAFGIQEVWEQATKKISEVPGFFGLGLSSLTVQSEVFKFLGKHTMIVPSTLYLSYNPLVAGEHEFINNVDYHRLNPDLHTSPETDVKDMTILRNQPVTFVDKQEMESHIRAYHTHVASKLTAPGHDQIWFGTVPQKETIAIHNKDRKAQLSILLKVLDGTYLSSALTK